MAAIGLIALAREVFSVFLFSLSRPKRSTKQSRSRSAIAPLDSHDAPGGLADEGRIRRQGIEALLLFCPPRADRFLKFVRCGNVLPRPGHPGHANRAAEERSVSEATEPSVSNARPCRGDVALPR